MKAKCPACGEEFRVKAARTEFALRDHDVSLQCPCCATVFDRTRFHEPQP